VTRPHAADDRHRYPCTAMSSKFSIPVLDDPYGFGQNESAWIAGP
jgi:hypothetical protein